MSFSFASPEVLIALLALPMLVAASWVYAGRLRKPAVRYPSLGLAPSGRRRSWRMYSGHILLVLRLAALALLIVALARPQTGSAREIVRGEGVDIALALDISGSMGARDLGPGGRIEAAKSAIADFVAEREHDRIGLVVFAEEAFLQAPPTLDHGVLLSLTERVGLAKSVGVRDGTAIGMGLATAATMLKDSDVESKVIVLLTDGVNNAGAIDPLTAAAAAEALDIRVYTIGVGRPSAFDFSGLGGSADLDEETLREISALTGGRYYRAVDPEGLARIYDEISQLEKSEIETLTFSNKREWAGWIMIPALALLLGELGLRRTLLRTLP